MSVAPVVIDTGSNGWGLLLTVNRDGSGEARISWKAAAAREPDFSQAVSHPALAIETLMISVEKLGALSPLHLPVLMGLVVCQLTGRAR